VSKGPSKYRKANFYGEQYGVGLGDSRYEGKGGMGGRSSNMNQDLIPNQYFGNLNCLIGINLIL